MANSKKETNQKAIVKSATLDLEKTGIKAELNQNDVIEVIAHEKYKSLMDEIHEINDNVHNIHSIKTKFIDEQKDIFASNLGVHGYITNEQKKSLILLDAIISSNKTSKKLAYYDFGLIRFNEYSKKREMTYTSIGYKLLEEDSVLRMTYSLTACYSDEKEEYGIEMKSNTNDEILFTKKVAVPTTIIRDYNNSLTAHHKRVKDFYDKYKGFTDDLDGMIRETRAKFNKELLKAKSPLIKGQIEQLFQVIL